jgi:hypothetical protein
MLIDFQHLFTLTSCSLGRNFNPSVVCSILRIGYCSVTVDFTVHGTASIGSTSNTKTPWQARRVAAHSTVTLPVVRHADLLNLRARHFSSTISLFGHRHSDNNRTFINNPFLYFRLTQRLSLSSHRLSLLILTRWVSEIWWHVTQFIRRGRVMWFWRGTCWCFKEFQSELGHYHDVFESWGTIIRRLLILFFHEEEDYLMDDDILASLRLLCLRKKQVNLFWNQFKKFQGLVLVAPMVARVAMPFCRSS